MVVDGPGAHVDRLDAEVGRLDAEVGRLDAEVGRLGAKAGRLAGEAGRTGVADERAVATPRRFAEPLDRPVVMCGTFVDLSGTVGDVSAPFDEV